MDDTPFPQLVHFIFGLSDDPLQRHFSYAHYLAVRAAHVHLQPATLLLHHAHLPTGEWWDAAVGMLTLRRVALPRSVFGRPLAHAAHRADVLRLQLLIRHGGIYLDLDVIALRPFAPLLPLLQHEASFLLGREGHPDHGGFHGLCNAVLIARPNASFGHRWLRQYATFGSSSVGDQWSGLSVQFPVQLAAAHPREVVLLPHTAFFWPDWDEAPLKALLLGASEDFAPSFVAPEEDAIREWVPPTSGASSQRRASPSPLTAAAADLSSAPATRSRFAVHLWTRLSADYVLLVWSPEYLHSVPSSLNIELARIAAAPEWWATEAAVATAAARAAGVPSGEGAAWTLDSAGRRTLRHTPLPPRALARPVALWPLRPSAPPRSAHLLEDVAGGRSHGWIYARGCSTAPAPPSSSANSASASSSAGSAGACWSDSGLPVVPGAGESELSLGYSEPLEGFVPLPPERASHVSVSWYAANILVFNY